MTWLRYATAAVVLAVCLACGAGGVPATPLPSAGDKADPAAVPAAGGGLFELSQHAAPSTAWGDSPATQAAAQWIRTELSPNGPSVGVAVRLVDGSPAHLVVVVRLDEDEMVADASMLEEALAIARSYAPDPADVGVAFRGASGWRGYATRLGSAMTIHAGAGEPSAELTALFAPGTSGARQVAPLVTGPNADVVAALNRAYDDGDDEGDDGESVHFRYTSLDCAGPTTCRVGLAAVTPDVTHTTVLDVSGFTSLRQDGAPSESFVQKLSAALLAWTATIDD